MHRISPFALLREAWRTVKRAWLPLVSVMLGFQLLMLIVVSPLISWLFREALRANGMVALDFSALRLTGGIAVSLTLILVIMLLAFWIASLQFIVLVLMLNRARNSEPISFTAVWGDVRHTARKLVRPSSFVLFGYMFFIVPISGFGFASVLSQGIAVPTFISGELMKSPTNAAIWIIFMLLIALLNLRFALSVPIFALTDATGGRAMRQSWRLTAGWASVRLVLAVAIVLFVASIVTLLLSVFTIGPTAIADVAWPAASPAVAAFSLGAAQLMGLVMVSLVLSAIGAALLELISQREDRLALDLRAPARAADALRVEGSPTPPGNAPLAESAPAAPEASRHRRGTLALIGAALLLSAGFGVFHLGTMQQLSQHPDTLVLGHRGFSGGGVENTIEGLEAAAQVKADLVEIDVMQTADKKFVVMHDSSLSRLASEDVMVKDLTLDELTKITVHDQFGHEGQIPSLEQYIRKAQELEMPLLIEVKSGGLDSADRVPLLVDELESLDAMDQNIFHTLDNPIVKELKELRPDATVGYILAIAGGGIPTTDADFVVVEQWSATQEMQDSAYREGLGFFSWTVNEDAHIRELLRRDVDGMITDHPDTALAARAEMQQETGLAGTLIDTISRFVVAF